MSRDDICGAREHAVISDMPEMSPLMTTREVAQLLRRTERTIRNWVRKGRLKPVRLGRAVYFRRVDIERLLDPQQNQKIE